MTEWIVSLTLKSLGPHCCGFESRQDHWILSFEKAILLGNVQLG